MTVSPSVCPHHIHSRCFCWEIVWPTGLLESKNQQQSRVFFDVIFYAYNHVDNRERARASDCKQKRCRNFVGRKTWKFGSGGEKMRNARGGQQEAARAAVKKTKSDQEQHIQQFLHKKMCNQEVSRFSREKGHCSHAKQRQRNIQKSVLHVQICFLLIRGFYWFCCRYHCRRRLLLHCFIFFVLKFLVNG